MQRNIWSVIHTFPEFEAPIKFLVQTDENFRDLCIDYELCLKTVNEIKHDSERNSGRLAEYGDLKESLEKEILHLIGKSKEAPSI